MWVTGISRSNTILRDIAKIACTANKDPNTQLPIPEKNWSLVFPSASAATYPVTGEVLSADATFSVYTASKQNWDPNEPVTVYVDGTAVDPAEYTVDYDLGRITFASAQSDTAVVTADYSWINSAFEESLAKITNRVILKTTTTPVAPGSGAYGDDPDQQVTQITMYLEIQKPERLVNPETGREDYLAVDRSLIATDENHHYMMMRVFDKINPVTFEPAEGAKTSEWAKCSWYMDFQEEMVDALDLDPGTTNIQDGVILRQIKVVGINGDLPIQYWASINNDRIIMVLMGDPGLDYRHYLCSFVYVGKIDSFEGGVNDTAGNFALTVGSSTVPAVLGKTPSGKPVVDRFVSVTHDGLIEDNTLYLYRISYTTDGGESAPSEPIIAQVYSEGATDWTTKAPYPTARVFLTYQTPLPDDAKEIRVYRAKVASGTAVRNYLRNWDEENVTYTSPDYAQGSTIYVPPKGVVKDNMSLGTLTAPSVSVRAKVRRRTSASYYGDAYISMAQDTHYTFDLNSFTVTIIDPPQMERGYNNTLDTFQEYVVDVLYHIDYAEPVFTPMGEAFNRDLRNFRLLKVTTDLSGSVSDDGAFPTSVDNPVLDGRPNPGVTRDPISGAVVSTRFPERYGHSTATGVQDIAMYKTRNGLYWQKHHAAFVTAEEFMPRNGFSPSRWTGKFHCSPVHVIHGTEGYRGTLHDVVVLDSASIVHLDELVVNKGTPDEETYKYFKLNTPFNFLTSSGNSNYGIAIKMV